MVTVLFPDCVFHTHCNSGSGQLPIPFSFKCAGMLAHCNLMLDIIKDCIPQCVPTTY